ncbi:MAG TPA: glycosyltransferase family A protein [Candidatus Paceibacterota bacterium]|nr:glycosyltransferase family A protein [Candidatus Paceibacterota bacterium]
MNLSIVIPAYNEERYISACLESIVQNGGDMAEIIVVDNNSTDTTAEVARQFPNVRVVRELVKGTSSARQRGFVESTGDIIAFVDADTRMPEGWVAKVCAAFEKDPKLVSISGPYIYDELSVLTNFLFRVLWIWPSVPVYWCTGYMIWGGNFALRREALAAIGGFNTNIVFYGDEVDLGKRLSKVGKVRFNLSLYMYSSPRRLLKEGILATCTRYGVNMFSQILLQKTITHGYTEIR